MKKIFIFLLFFAFFALTGIAQDKSYQLSSHILDIRKHTIFRLDAHYSQPYLCAVTFNNNDYGKRKSKLSGGI